jgi:hypothetical protein
MSTHVDANVSHLASRLAATAKKHKEENGSDEENEDDIFAELEAEIEQESGAGMANMREHGIQGLKEEYAVLLRLLCYLVSCSFQDREGQGHEDQWLRSPRADCGRTTSHSLQCVSIHRGRRDRV